MFYRLTQSLNSARLKRAFAGILRTSPIESRAGEPRIVSMVCSRDVLPYLVALKGFHRQLGGGEVVALNDGSLTDADKDVLRTHVTGIRFREMEEGRPKGLPRGGCWERLCIMALESRDAYAIQLDADIVCRGPVDEVRDLVRAGRPFALSDGVEPGWRPIGEMARYVATYARPDGHIQDVAELALGQAGLPEERHYLRGTAAFAGFPPGRDVMPLIHEFHEAMSKAVGSRWDDWGSEQVASNYVVGNSGEALPLVGPRYVNNKPETDLSAASLIHFFGTHRYYEGHYPRTGREVISQMLESRS